MLYTWNITNVLIFCGSFLRVCLEPDNSNINPWMKSLIWLVWKPKRFGSLKALSFRKLLRIKPTGLCFQDCVHSDLHISVFTYTLHNGEGSESMDKTFFNLDRISGLGMLSIARNRFLIKHFANSFNSAACVNTSYRIW